MGDGPTARNLNDLLDRAAISDTKLRYATGVDRRDWPLYRSIFADSIDIDFTSWSGLAGTMAADAWVAMVRDTLACFDATQHSLTNHVITLNGDAAHIVVYMVARHYFAGEMQMLGGYYTDLLRRDGDGWKITACNLVITWEQGDRALFERARANARSDVRA